ncbi:hypothetical protein GDO86_019144 [Hymenochirus boettgeri]|uniref:NTF2 domain-containing protein n=1 Tax=Hymenochirus boettgeri TaxID=247094 RepID=A0A8T2IL44_9PIPI|nr:hypothetical protein GDO86_019144 [Hymenochirus boettgeri]
MTDKKACCIKRFYFAKEKVHEQTYDSLDCQKLGEEFCKWFYQLLNAENPSLAQERGDWGPQHFWDNSVLKFEYNTTQTNREEYRGAQMASLRLLSLTREETLIFNPNMDSEGLKCANTPHGLVVVAVAGTVHRDNFCLGIFEQIFGLVNCPVTKNWKIKCINLKIIGHNVSGPSESLTRPCIKYETRDLEKLL